MQTSAYWDPRYFGIAVVSDADRKFLKIWSVGCQIMRDPRRMVDGAMQVAKGTAPQIEVSIRRADDWKIVFHKLKNTGGVPVGIDPSQFRHAMQ